MEKVLRKVSYFDRKPEKSGYYYTNCGEAKYDGKLFYSVTKVIESNKPDFTQAINIFPEYWYEEVSLEELKAKQYNRGFNDCYNQMNTTGLEVQKRAFDAARKGLIRSELRFIKYKTFEDYLKILEI